MEYIEITGKTVDEAITNATIKLSVTSDKLEYEVIDKGSNGFLGINRRPAVIKVRIADAQDEFEQVVKEAVAAPKQESRPFKKPEVKKVDTQAPKNEFKRASENVAKPVNTEKPLQVKSTPAQKPEENMDKTSKRPVAGDNMEPAIRKFLGDVLKAMGMEAEVKVVIDENEGSVDIELVGENMGVLIGKRGQTLDSIQYLTSLVVNKGKEKYVRIKVDTENYRQRRNDTLESLAKNIAYKVKRTKRPVSLEPMNPFERRVIHSALQGDRYVETHSEGEEPFRHVVVTLKK